jgi:hypothetical protein
LFSWRVASGGYACVAITRYPHQATRDIFHLPGTGFIASPFWSFVMRTRLVISAILVTLYGAFRSFYTVNARYIVEAQLAPLQVTNDNIQYGLSSTLTIADFVGAFFMMMIVSSLIFMWLSFYLNHSAPKLEPSKVDRFFMRHFSPSETGMMTTMETDTSNS